MTATATLPQTQAFRAAVDAETELVAIDASHAPDLFQVLDANRAHLSTWHPWVRVIQSEAHVRQLIGDWQRHHEKAGAIHTGIWRQGKLCGMLGTIGVDRMNSWIVLSYWLSADAQGKGIMTASCRTLIDYAFGSWGMNRVTIESASENRRSRAIPERLGFTYEGNVRAIERIGDRYVDHALYGLLRSEWKSAGADFRIQASTLKG